MTKEAMHRKNVITKRGRMVLKKNTPVLWR